MISNSLLGKIHLFTDSVPELPARYRHSAICAKRAAASEITAAYERFPNAQLFITELDEIKVKRFYHVEHSKY
jgi:hypothetical protein